MSKLACAQRLAVVTKITIHYECAITSGLMYTYPTDTDVYCEKETLFC